MSLSGNRTTGKAFILPESVSPSWKWECWTKWLLEFSPILRQWRTDALGVYDGARVMEAAPTPKSLYPCSSEPRTWLRCVSLYMFKFFFFFLFLSSFLQESCFPSPEIQLYWILSLWFFWLYLLRLKIQWNLLRRPPGFTDHLPKQICQALILVPRGVLQLVATCFMGLWAAHQVH